MSERFKACLAETLKWEGGWSNHPHDPGGFPALSTMLSEQGTDVTSEAIVAAADHIAREQLEAARAT